MVLMALHIECPVSRRRSLLTSLRGSAPAVRLPPLLLPGRLAAILSLSRIDSPARMLTRRIQDAFRRKALMALQTGSAALAPLWHRPITCGLLCGRALNSPIHLPAPAR